MTHDTSSSESNTLSDTQTSNTPSPPEFTQLYKRYSGKVLATLVRLLGDFDLAEEAMHDAFVAAMEKWGAEGLPENPVAWLVSTGRFNAIDSLRRKTRLGELCEEWQQLATDLDASTLLITEQDIEDDQLRLIFACCHPAIDPKVQVPLTLREVCGLSTEEIASAFLVTPTTMAQRIVRGKNKIQQAKIPFIIPAVDELPERLDAVLSVIYLVFNEGYAASSGDSLTRHELSHEAIRLARLLVTLVSDPEVRGLLALMLLHESRRKARTDANGDIVLLEEQDRSLWDREKIAEGIALVRESLASRRFSVYTLQAAIAAVHAEAPSVEQTDWHQVVSLYSVLFQMEPSPIIALNRGVAIAMRDGPTQGLDVIDALSGNKTLSTYHLYHSARGELLRRAGRTEHAIAAFQTALTLAKQAPEQRFLRKKLAQLQDA